MYQQNSTSKSQQVIRQLEKETFSNCKPSCIQKLNSIIKLNKFGIRRSSMKESSVTRIKVINYKVALNFFFLFLFLPTDSSFYSFRVFRCKSYDITDYSLHVRQEWRFCIGGKQIFPDYVSRTIENYEDGSDISSLPSHLTFPFFHIPNLRVLLPLLPFSKLDERNKNNSFVDLVCLGSFGIGKCHKNATLGC